MKKKIAILMLTTIPFLTMALPGCSISGEKETSTIAADTQNSTPMELGTYATLILPENWEVQYEDGSLAAIIVCDGENVAQMDMIPENSGIVAGDAATFAKTFLGEDAVVTDILSQNRSDNFLCQEVTVTIEDEVTTHYFFYNTSSKAVADLYATTDNVQEKDMDRLSTGVTLY